LGGEAQIRVTGTRIFPRNRKVVKKLLNVTVGGVGASYV
jgi:hypothetical protein